MTQWTRPAAVCGALLGLALVTGSAERRASAQTPVPTFTKDVAPILHRSCATCHRPGEIAPMSLLTYEAARPWARAMRRAVEDGTMPPWHADPAHGRFENARGLTGAEVETIARWAEGGAPRGNPADMPPVPTFADGWTIGTPDAVFEMTEPYDVPADGTVAYQYFEVPTHLTGDRWVQAIEVRPGNRSVVHHVLVFERASDDKAERDAARPTRLFRRILPDPKQDPETEDTPSPFPLNRLIATTAPGTNATVFRPGTALRLRAGTTLVFQIHYTTSGDPTPDRTRVGVVFADTPPRQEIHATHFLNPQLLVPAGAADHRVEVAVEFVADTTLYGIFPHTHLRGKRWEYRLDYPDGRAEVLLSVPRYDFNWQTYYLYAEPVAVPSGARLTAIAHYDNSRANRANPDPTVDVRWGEQTWEEMHYTGLLLGRAVEPATTSAAR